MAPMMAGLRPAGTCITVLHTSEKGHALLSIFLSGSLIENNNRGKSSSKIRN
jgi:hypothetical protein